MMATYGGQRKRQKRCALVTEGLDGTLRCPPCPPTDLFSVGHQDVDVDGNAAVGQRRLGEGDQGHPKQSLWNERQRGGGHGGWIVMLF